MTDDLVEVVLLHLPVGLWLRSTEQSEALQREFALVAADPHDVPARLLHVVATVQAKYGQPDSPQEQQLYDALDSGRPVLERLVYQVPTVIGEVAQQLAQIFDEADAFCRAGRHLLTIAADDEIVRFRWWFLDQFTDQTAGRPAVAWPDYRPGSGRP